MNAQRAYAVYAAIVVAMMAWSNSQGYVYSTLFNTAATASKSANGNHK